MNIAGFQKVSTIDYPGEICCVVFLHGCNFRCGFCYNSDIVLGEPKNGFNEKEVFDFLKKRKEKLDAVCISGGEPLATLDFDFVRKIKDMGYKVKVDTNGSFPERLKELIDKELIDYIAMDIKGDKEDYSRIAGVNVDIKNIEKSIRLVNDFPDSEFRTTVVGRYHKEDEIKRMGEWLNEICDKEPGRIFFQGFRNNLGKMIDGDFSNEKNIDEKYLEKIKEVANDYFNEVGVRF